MFSFAVISATGEYSYLVDKDVNFIREAYPNPNTSGRPKYYGVFDGDTGSTEGRFIIGPTTDASYQVELHYYRDPESIVTSSTSWLGENASGALLYGAIVEAYTYVKGDADLMKMYSDRYDTAMSQLSTLSARTMRDDYRDGRA